MVKKTINFILKAIAFFEEYLVAGTLILIAGLMCLQVVMRYVFSMRLLGYEELARYTAMWMAFIGAAYTTRMKAHVKADILSLFIKNPRTLKKAEIIQDLISFIFCSSFLYWLWILLKGNNFRSPALNIPVWIPQLGIMIGFILMSGYFLAFFIKGLRSLNQPKKKESE